MPPAPPGPRSALRATLRALLAALALLLALLAHARLRGWRAAQAGLAATLENSGLTAAHPEVTREIARDPDAGRAGLRAARALLAAELDSRGSGADRGGAEGSRRRIAAARELAAAGLRDRPGSWEAAMILGGASYLEGLRRGDPELYYAGEPWRKPLAAARALAPGQPEPRRFLAAAALDSWFLLSQEERRQTRRLLREAFRDEGTFRLLIGAWLRAAPDVEAAHAVVPETPGAWERLMAIHAGEGRWEAYSAARRRWRSALTDDLEGRLQEAEARLHGGDLRGARSLLLAVPAQAPPDLRYARLVARSLELCPPGPVGPGHARAFSRWLDWSLELCLLRGCPLPPAGLGRLAGGAEGLPLHRSALAALAAENLPQAERIERRADSAWREEWGPYLLYKAKLLAAAGDGPGARVALEGIHREWTSTALYLRTRRQVAEAMGDAAAVEEATSGLARLAATSWPATAWRYRSGVARLELLPATAAQGIALDLDAAPPQGAAVELRWDGAARGTYPVGPGGTLAVRAPIPAGGIHLLELVSLSGGRVFPGEVRLLPPP